MLKRRTRRKDTVFYRTVPHYGCLVFAPKEVALRVAGLHRALAKARTWGQFRAMVSPADYSEVVRASFDDMYERRPTSTDKFSAEQVAGWSDGDYPEWLQQNMDLYLPEDLLQRYGEAEETVINGDVWMIPPENAAAMIHELEALGFIVKRRSDLPFH